MTKTSYTPVRLTQHERQALEDAAKASGSTVSAALRLAIRATYGDTATKKEGCADRLDNYGASLPVNPTHP